MDTQQKISERIKGLLREQFLMDLSAHPQNIKRFVGRAPPAVPGHQLVRKTHPDTKDFSGQGYSVKPFGEKLGIFNLGRMVNNERNWTIKNLDKIAGALGVTVGALVQDFIDIPLLVEVGSAPFPFPLEIRGERAMGWVPAPMPVYGGGKVSKMYAISVKNERIFRKPRTLIIEKNGDKIESGDQVVYCCPEGFGHIGEVTIYEDKVLFKALDPMDPFQDKLLDRGQLRMMDRVSYTRHH